MLKRQRMLSRGALLIVLGIVSGSVTGCSPSSPPQLQASGPISVVRFPGAAPWVKRVGESNRVLNDNPHYVLRKSAEGELLFSVKQGFTGEWFGRDVSDFAVKNPAYDYFSDSRYAVRLGGDVQVRPAKEEWDAGEKVLHGYHFISTFEKRIVTEDGVKYNGRLLRKPGSSWGTRAAHISPRGA